MSTVEDTHKMGYPTNPDHSGIEWQVSEHESGEPGASSYGANPHAQSHVKDWVFGAGTGPAGSAGTSKQP